VKTLLGLAALAAALVVMVRPRWRRRQRVAQTWADETDQL